MGLDYSVDVAYGFIQKDEATSVLLQKLGSEEEYLDGTPDSQILAELGYRGLAITESLTPNGSEGWAIFADSTHKHISPRYEDGIWNLEDPSEASISELKRLRDQLFPKLSWENTEQPKLGWFLISSAY